MDQQVYSCCRNFLTVTQSYNSKITPIGKFDSVKMAKSVLLYIFTMTFTMSPLCEIINNYQNKDSCSEVNYLNSDPAKTNKQADQTN